MNKLSTLLLYTSILIFIIAFNFTDNPPGGWYQQFLPDIGGRQITDITFLDSLTGYAVANQPSDTSYILKTTNGGDNWQILYRNFFAMTRLQFLNLNTGYACGGYIYKTTDGGFGWNQINTPASTAENMYVLNQDTLWFVNSDPLAGGVYRTTNGGRSWSRQFSAGVGNPNKIYMYNKDIGFISGNNVYKTTNSGVNWILIPGATPFNDMFFIDSLTGWKSNEDIQRTTNGGINWTTLPLPPKGIPVIYNGTILLSRIKQFSNLNKDTIWGVGGSVFFGSGRFRGLIYKSTNGGNTWGYQLPDTSIDITIYPFSQFTNQNNGWAYNVATGVHTITGGDSITYTKVNNVSSEVPEEFLLNQNYPNPFNPHTKINYEIRIANHVMIKIYNLGGKEIETLVNKKQSAGEYEIEFDGSNLPSGVYFYSLYIEGNRVESKKMVLVR